MLCLVTACQEHVQIPLDCHGRRTKETLWATKLLHQISEDATRTQMKGARAVVSEEVSLQLCLEG